MLAALDEATAGDNPISFFAHWFGEAEAARITEINAMTLATADSNGKPHARIVLLKGLENDGFVFYTNYDSAKGQQIAANPQAALLFFWKELERQVRIEGILHKLPDTDSDAYFHSRPEGSRIGAWASPQSQAIPHRELLDLNFAKYEQEFSGISIPRPPHWGGYVLIPTSLEFWQGRSSRMHDRIVFALQADGRWAKSRLAP